MTLPNKCPTCGDTEKREAPQGGYAFFKYTPPAANIRKIGTAAKKHNENAVARLHQAKRAPATEIVVCNACGDVYAIEPDVPEKPVLTSKPAEPADKPEEG